MAVVTDAALDRIIELLDADITHIGIGTGAAPIASDTLLNTETERKTITTTIDDTTIIFEAYWDESEANGTTYTTGGCFCDGATITVDTGTLFAGGSINVNKNSTQSLTVSVEITVEAVNT